LNDPIVELLVLGSGDLQILLQHLNDLQLFGKNFICLGGFGPHLTILLDILFSIAKVAQHLIQLKALLVELLLPNSYLFATSTFVDSLVSFRLQSGDGYVHFLDHGLVLAFQDGEVILLLASFLFLVGQILSEIGYSVFKLFDFDDICIGLASLEGGSLYFQFEVSDVGLGLSDVVFGTDKMFSDLIVVQVKSVDFLHEEDDLDDSFTVVQPQGIIGFLVYSSFTGSFCLLFMVVDGDLVLVDSLLILVDGGIELLYLGLVDCDFLLELNVDGGEIADLLSQI